MMYWIISVVFVTLGLAIVIGDILKEIVVETRSQPPPEPWHLAYAMMFLVWGTVIGYFGFEYDAQVWTHLIGK